MSIGDDETLANLTQNNYYLCVIRQPSYFGPPPFVQWTTHLVDSPAIAINWTESYNVFFSYTSVEADKVIEKDATAITTLRTTCTYSPGVCH